MQVYSPFILNKIFSITKISKNYFRHKLQESLFFLNIASSQKVPRNGMEGVLFYIFTCIIYVLINELLFIIIHLGIVFDISMFLFYKYK